MERKYILIDNLKLTEYDLHHMLMNMGIRLKNDYLFEQDDNKRVFTKEEVINLREAYKKHGVDCVCDICNHNAKIYNYVLNDESSIDVCETCGKVLYEFDIDTDDRLLELCAMVRYRELVDDDVKRKELKK